MTTTTERVITVIETELELPVGTVGPEATNETLDQWDSLGHLRICLALEQEFGVSFELDQLADLLSVQAIVAAVERS